MYAWGSKPYLNVLFFSFRFGELSLVMSVARFPFFCCLSQFLHLHGGLVLISRLWLKVLGCHDNAHLLFFSPFNYFDTVFLPVLSQFLIFFFLFIEFICNVLNPIFLDFSFQHLFFFPKCQFACWLFLPRLLTFPSTSLTFASILLIFPLGFWAPFQSSWLHQTVCDPCQVIDHFY